MRGGAKRKWQVSDVVHLHWVIDDIASSPWAGQRYSGHGCIFLVVDIKVARHGHGSGTCSEMW